MKTFIKTTFYFLAILTFFSCTENNEIDSNFNFISFLEISEITVNQGSTFDQTIAIYASQISGSERTINISVNEDKSSADPDSYNFPSYITIPANSNKGEFILTISDVNIENSGENIVIKFNDSDNYFTGNSINIDFKKYCVLTIDNFLGAYTITEEGYGDYDTTITLDPLVPNRVWVTNFWDWTTELAYYDFNANDGTVNMPAQPITMGDGNIYNCVGTGTYNACAGTFHMEYQGDVEGTIHDFTPK